MIAPRKTLWSTPDAVIEELIIAFPLSSADRVIDIGCGDGRVILQWAATVTSRQAGVETEFPSFLGVDIDNNRIERAQSLLADHIKNGTIHGSLQINFVCANALEQESMFMGATVFFLYLIPRGLRIIHPILREQLLTNKSKCISNDTISAPCLRIATYMSPLEGEKASEVVKVAVSHQPGAHWPLYLYRFEQISMEGS